MAKTENMVRMGIAFFLDNPEHKKAYDILQAAENKNQLIRDALIAYNRNKDYLEQLPTREEMRVIVANAVEYALQKYMNPDATSDTAQKDAETVNEIDMEKLKKFL